MKYIAYNGIYKHILMHGVADVYMIVSITIVFIQYNNEHVAAAK